VHQSGKLAQVSGIVPILQKADTSSYAAWRWWAPRIERTAGRQGGVSSCLCSPQLTLWPLQDQGCSGGFILALTDKLRRVSEFNLLSPDTWLSGMGWGDCSLPAQPQLHVYVCVCVCVCARARARAYECVWLTLHPMPCTLVLSTVCMCVCVRECLYLHLFLLASSCAPQLPRGLQILLASLRCRTGWFVISRAQQLSEEFIFLISFSLLAAGLLLFF
jgi:hypothetical protein